MFDKDLAELETPGNDRDLQIVSHPNVGQRQNAYSLSSLMDEAERQVQAYCIAFRKAEIANRSKQHEAINAIFQLHYFLTYNQSAKKELYDEKGLVAAPTTKYPALPLVKHFLAGRDSTPELQTKCSYWAGAVQAGILKKVSPSDFLEFLQNTKNGIHGAYKIAANWGEKKQDRLELAINLIGAHEAYNLKVPGAEVQPSDITRHLRPGRYQAIIEVDSNRHTELVACHDPNPVSGEKAYDAFVTEWSRSGQKLKPPTVFKKAKRRHDKALPRANPIVLKDNHQAVTQGKTAYPKLVRKPRDGELVLKSGVHSRKLGSHVETNKWFGYPIFSLTLPERSTCPKTCAFWDRCYGNGMSQSTNIRYEPGPELINAIHNQLIILNTEPETRNGFVVRLHVLGDFYDIDYLRHWLTWLEEFQALHIFGFTAWQPDTELGAAIRNSSNENWDRFAIRTSSARDQEYGSDVISHEIAESYQGKSLICPAEKRVKKCCGNCGYCWSSTNPVMFIEH